MIEFQGTIYPWKFRERNKISSFSFLFTSSIKRQLIGHFHVLVVQKQEINLPKKKNVMHVQSCFLLIKLLVFVLFFF